MKVGIIGVGFVGHAIKNAYDVAGIDTVCIDPAKGYHADYSELADCLGVFVCVPSPVNKDGSCDSSYLESVMQNLKNYTGVIISKVTAPPDVYMRLQKDHPTLVHSPEFLRAVSADSDYLNGTVAILGGEYTQTVLAAAVIVKGQTKISKITYIPIGEASVVKYLENCFLATKVVFMNEIAKLATAIGLDYDIIKQAVQYDERQGNSHFDVPGPDGQFGFGGHCFPKDTSAFLKYANDNQIELTVLAQAVATNNIIRNS
jgi:UDPglucose 6-dehydrogenase